MIDWEDSYKTILNHLFKYLCLARYCGRILVIVIRNVKQCKSYKNLNSLNVYAKINICHNCCKYLIDKLCINSLIDGFMKVEHIEINVFKLITQSQI